MLIIDRGFRDEQARSRPSRPRHPFFAFPEASLRICDRRSVITVSKEGRSGANLRPSSHRAAECPRLSSSRQSHAAAQPDQLLLGVQLQYSGIGHIGWHAGLRRDHGADYQEPGG